MRTPIFLLSAAALMTAGMTSGCGKQTLALSQDPIDRAAQCGVVVAAAARKGQTDIKAPLSFETQGRIMHPAMLAAAKPDGFSTETAAAVVDRMPQIEAKITSAKFETLEAPCHDAFPQAAVTAVTLPKDPVDSRLGCYQLGAFLVRALQNSGDAYSVQMGQYGAMRRGLDEKIAADLRQRGIASKSDAAEKLRSASLAEFVRLGSPMDVMKVCLDRFGQQT